MNKQERDILNILFLESLMKELLNNLMELVQGPDSTTSKATIGISYLAEEQALYQKYQMIVCARVVHSADVVEINTYEQLRELYSDSNQSVIKKGMTNRSFFFYCKGENIP